MALIDCPECGNEISDEAQSCPNCGYPINTPPTERHSSAQSNPNRNEGNSCLGTILYWGGFAWIGFMIIVAINAFGGDSAVSDQQLGARFIVSLAFIIPGVISIWMGSMLNK